MKHIVGNPVNTYFWGTPIASPAVDPPARRPTARVTSACIDSFSTIAPLVNRLADSPSMAKALRPTGGLKAPTSDNLIFDLDHIGNTIANRIKLFESVLPPCGTSSHGAQEHRYCLSAALRRPSQIRPEKACGQPQSPDYNKFQVAKMTLSPNQVRRLALPSCHLDLSSLSCMVMKPDNMVS